MGKLEQAIQEAIRKGGRRAVATILTGVATGVGEHGFTLTREGAPDIYDVRLASLAESGDTYIKVWPAEGSEVLVGLIGGMATEAVLLKCSEVDKVHLVLGGELVINGGELGGMVKVAELTKQLNGLVDEVNALVKTFNAHTHIVSTTGTAAAQTGTAAATTTTAQEAGGFSQADYENEKVKH